MKTKFRTLSLKFTLLLFTIITLSCSNNNEVRSIEIGNRYSLKIPSFLTKVNNLNEEASLQYQHAWKELYVIVIEDPKEEVENTFKKLDLPSNFSNDLEGYTNMVLFNMTENTNSDSDKYETIKINQLPAKIIETTENIDGINIYYNVAVLEGKEKYYQIFTWTLASKKQEHKLKMDRIIQSFQEI